MPPYEGRDQDGDYPMSGERRDEGLVSLVFRRSLGVERGKQVEITNGVGLLCYAPCPILPCTRNLAYIGKRRDPCAQ